MLGSELTTSACSFPCPYNESWARSENPHAPTTVAVTPTIKHSMSLLTRSLRKGVSRQEGARPTRSFGRIQRPAQPKAPLCFALGCHPKRPTPIDGQDTGGAGQRPLMAAAVKL